MPDAADTYEGVAYKFSAQRKRRLLGQPVRLQLTSATDVETAFPDAATYVNGFSWILPFDYIRGTAISFHALFVQTATVGTPNMIWNSQLGLAAIGSAFSNTNLENVAAITQGLAQNIQTELVRGGTGLLPTLTSLITRFNCDYEIHWLISRQGGHANDTVNGSVFLRHVWMEYYSTYDYQNLIND